MKSEWQANDDWTTQDDVNEKTKNIFEIHQMSLNSRLSQNLSKMCVISYVFLCMFI
jgi:hypothetical protein